MAKKLHSKGIPERPILGAGAPINGELYEHYDEEIQNTVNLLSTFHGTMTAEADVGGYKLDRGLQYNWSQATFEVSIYANQMIIHIANHPLLIKHFLSL